MYTSSIYKDNYTEFLESALPTAIMLKFNVNMDIANAWKETVNIFR